MKARRTGYKAGLWIVLIGAVILAACLPATPAGPQEPLPPNPAFTALQKMIAEFHNKAWEEFPRKYATPDKAAAGIVLDYGWNVIPSADFLNNFYSPFVTLTRMQRQCDETALLVAYAVADDGYPPLIMFLYSENQNYIGANHALFLFQKNGLWGYTDWTHYVEPQYKNIEELFYTYQKTETAYVSYTLFNFDLYKGDWKGSVKPLVIGDDIATAKGPTTAWLFRTPLKDETGTATRVVNLDLMNSGSVDNENVISTAMLAGLTNSCCGKPPTETEALMTFDLSPIPKDAQIVSTLVDFRQFLYYGDPFVKFNCLEVFKESFSDLRMVKFENSPDGFITRWCTQRDISSPLYMEDFRIMVQDSLQQGILQIRLKFVLPDDPASVVGNQMVFNPNIMLVVTYSLTK